MNRISTVVPHLISTWHRTARMRTTLPAVLIKAKSNNPSKEHTAFSGADPKPRHVRKPPIITIAVLRPVQFLKLLQSFLLLNTLPLKISLKSDWSLTGRFPSTQCYPSIWVGQELPSSSWRTPSSSFTKTKSSLWPHTDLDSPGQEARPSWPHCVSHANGFASIHSFFTTRQVHSKVKFLFPVAPLSHCLLQGFNHHLSVFLQRLQGPRDQEHGRWSP